jgi:hypothetical protein
VVVVVGFVALVTVFASFLHDVRITTATPTPAGKAALQHIQSIIKRVTRGFTEGGYRFSEGLS